jgi:hypothetical protein
MLPEMSPCSELGLYYTVHVSVSGEFARCPIWQQSYNFGAIVRQP